MEALEVVLMQLRHSINGRNRVLSSAWVMTWLNIIYDQDHKLFSDLLINYTGLKYNISDHVGQEISSVTDGGRAGDKQLSFVNWYAFEQMWKKKSVYLFAWFCNAEGFSFAICKHPLKIITLRSSFNPHKMQRISWFCSSLSCAERMSFSRKWLHPIFECGASAQWRLLRSNHIWAQMCSTAFISSPHQRSFTSTPLQIHFLHTFLWGLSSGSVQTAC